LIPLKDDNPRVMFPIFNYVLIFSNVAVYIYQFLMPAEIAQDFILTYGAIPSKIVQGANLYGLFTAMFLHGGLLHLLGNMLYLWIFGDNVEGVMGHSRYLVFYLLCGLAATVSHIAIEPDSTLPMIGASGAVSGVLGAYALKFPRARVLIAVPIFICLTTFRVPALIVLGLWFFTQVTNGLAGLGLDVGGGVAWFAHIGGFVAGLLLVNFFQRRQSVQVFRRQVYYDDE
jgi:membrane associated rhomboid family serine protease